MPTCKECKNWSAPPCGGCSERCGGTCTDKNDSCLAGSPACGHFQSKAPAVRYFTPRRSTNLDLGYVKVVGDKAILVYTNGHEADYFDSLDRILSDVRGGSRQELTAEQAAKRIEANKQAKRIGKLPRYFTKMGAGIELAYMLLEADGGWRIGRDGTKLDGKPWWSVNQILKDLESGSRRELTKEQADALCTQRVSKFYVPLRGFLNDRTILEAKPDGTYALYSTNRPVEKYNTTEHYMCEMLKRGDIIECSKDEADIRRNPEPTYFSDWYGAFWIFENNKLEHLHVADTNREPCYTRSIDQLFLDGITTITMDAYLDARKKYIRGLLVDGVCFSTVSPGDWLYNIIRDGKAYMVSHRGEEVAWSYDDFYTEITFNILYGTRKILTAAEVDDLRARIPKGPYTISAEKLANAEDSILRVVNEFDDRESDLTEATEAIQATFANLRR